MAQIQSGVDSTLQTIDPTSKAARVTLYDSAGNEVNPAGAVNQYMVPVRAVQTAATASGTVWALKNGATKTLYIRRIYVVVSFAGTTATTGSQYELRRVTTGTAGSFSGGTALTPARKRTSYAVSTVADCRFLDTGLTETTVTVDNPLAFFGLARGLSAAALYDVYFGDGNERGRYLEIAPNEGLSIKLGVAAVIGDAIEGFIDFHEA